MEIQFCIQDPSHSETAHLHGAIRRAAVQASAWRGVYAFASPDGVDWLFDDPIIDQLLTDGCQVDLVVGLDAITNRRTLEHLQKLETRHENFRPRVFWNEIAQLFHPKLSEFTYPDGRRTLIVGSGNLTPAGLVNNVEGYTIISADPHETIDVSDLDQFIARHADSIRQIDEEALARAEQNLVRRRAGRVRLTAPQRSRKIQKLVPVHGEDHPVRVDRVLIAQAPRAGNRWSQIHFNADVVKSYFRVSDLANQRVYLTPVLSDGARSNTEVRPCILSSANKNHKIEFGEAKGKAYPELGQGRPVLVLRERQVRVFDYMLLFPGFDGHMELIGLTDTLPRVGNGLPRVMTDLDRLEQAWAECPLLASDDDEDDLV